MDRERGEVIYNLLYDCNYYLYYLYSHDMTYVAQRCGGWSVVGG